jgi:hypothetical protein
MGLTRPRLGQFQTTTTAFDDEIIVLNNSASGTNTKDIGIVFERGDSTNTALIWDESTDTFAFISTTEQGSTQGNVSISSYSALKVGSFVASGLSFPTSDGSNGQSIVTDGNGNLSFSSSSAGVVDWETDQGATNIHSGNYTNTTYTVGDGGLTQINFTSADNTKLDGIATSANNYSLPFSYTSANTVNNVVQRDGSGNFSAGTITATCTTAQYADLAENYVSDNTYAIGTVLVFGGTKEVTISSTKEDKRIAGVVSSNPAYLMNSECNGEYIVPIALQGRVPCRVVGVVEKGDIIVSSDVNGVGVAWNENYNPITGAVIGKSLVNKNTNDEDIIEVVVGVR